MAELDLASLVVSVKADVRDAVRGIDNVNSRLKTMEGTVEETGRTTEKVQKEMTQGWMAINQQLQAFKELESMIGKPLLGFFKNAVNGASDLQETISKTSVVFKEYADEVIEWGETATRTMGLSRNSALSMASSFGDLATSMGLSTARGKDMAMNLTQLAADLASFKNIDAQQAFTALQGIFTGNTQALKGLGVVMNETTLQAYALSQGITTSYNAMSEADKVALRYQFVLAQTSNAQGDFMRTSDGLANSQRTLKESLEDLTSSLGEMVLPLVEGFVSILNGIIGYLNEMPDGFKQLITSLGLAATAFTVVIPLINRCSLAIEALKAAASSGVSLVIAGVSAAVIGLTALIGSLNTATDKALTTAEKIDAVRDRMNQLDGSTATVSVDMNVKTDKIEEAELKIELQKGNIQTKVGEIQSIINNLRTQAGLVPIEVSAIKWKDKNSPQDLADKSAVDVALEADGITIADTDIEVSASAETVSVGDNDVEVIASSDKVEVGDNAVDVEANATQWKQDGDPQTKLKGSSVDVEITVDGIQKTPQEYIDEQTYNIIALTARFQQLADGGYISEDELTAMRAEVQAAMNDIGAKIIVDDESEIAFVDELEQLYGAWETLDVSLKLYIDYLQIIKDVNTAIKLANVAALISKVNIPVKLGNPIQDYLDYKSSITNLGEAIDAYINLQEGQGSSQTAKDLLADLNNLKEKYDPELVMNVAPADLETLKTIAGQFKLIVDADFALQRLKSTKTLEGLATDLAALYTGEDSDNFVANLKSVIEVMSGWDDDDYWSDLADGIRKAVSASQDWETAITNINTQLDEAFTKLRNEREEAIADQLSLATERALAAEPGSPEYEAAMKDVHIYRKVLEGFDEETEKEREKLVPITADMTDEEYIAAMRKNAALTSKNGKLASTEEVENWDFSKYSTDIFASQAAKSPVSEYSILGADETSTVIAKGIEDANKNRKTSEYEKRLAKQAIEEYNEEVNKRAQEYEDEGKAAAAAKREEAEKYKVSNGLGGYKYNQIGQSLLDAADALESTGTFNKEQYLKNHLMNAEEQQVAITKFLNEDVIQAAASYETGITGLTTRQDVANWRESYQQLYDEAETPEIQEHYGNIIRNLEVIDRQLSAKEFAKLASGGKIEEIPEGASETYIEFANLVNTLQDKFGSDMEDPAYVEAAAAVVDKILNQPSLLDIEQYGDAYDRSAVNAAYDKYWEQAYADNYIDEAENKVLGLFDSLEAAIEEGASELDIGSIWNDILKAVYNVDGSAGGGGMPSAETIIEGDQTNVGGDQYNNSPVDNSTNNVSITYSGGGGGSVEQQSDNFKLNSANIAKLLDRAKK